MLYVQNCVFVSFFLFLMYSIPYGLYGVLALNKIFFVHLGRMCFFSTLEEIYKKTDEIRGKS